MAAPSAPVAPLAFPKPKFPGGEVGSAMKSKSRSSSMPEDDFRDAPFGVPVPLLGLEVDARGRCEYASLASRATDISLRTMFFTVIIRTR
jgi:hypothetical protein